MTLTDRNSHDKSQFCRKNAGITRSPAELRPSVLVLGFSPKNPMIWPNFDKLTKQKCSTKIVFLVYKTLQYLNLEYNLLTYKGQNHRNNY